MQTFVITNKSSEYFEHRNEKFYRFDGTTLYDYEVYHDNRGVGELLVDINSERALVAFCEDITDLMSSGIIYFAPRD